MADLTTLSPSRRFSRIINRLDAVLRAVEQCKSIDDLANGRVPDPPHRTDLEHSLTKAVQLLELLDREQATAIERGKPVLTGLPKAVQERYGRLFPRRTLIRSAYFNVLFADLFDIMDPEPDSEGASKVTQAQEASPSGDSQTPAAHLALREYQDDDEMDSFTTNPIRHLIRFEVEHAANDIESGELEMDPRDYEGACQVVNSPWFRPDDWFEASRSARLLALSREHRSLPHWMNLRIQDLYRSLVTGNPTATIALARATLEAALNDCANFALKGIRRETLKELRGSRNGLNAWLAEYQRAGINLPFNFIRNTVKRYGDQVMHRSESEIGPIRSRDTAVQCCEVVIETVELLYNQ